MTAEASVPGVIGLPVGPKGAVVTVGTFDGMHRGHQDVLAQLAARSRDSGLPSVVVTFEPHPLEVVNPAAAPPLLTLHDEKLELFAQVGVSYVAVLPFTPALAALEADAFVDQILRRRYGMRELLVGHDHGFGRGRLGDIDLLKRLGVSRGFDVTVLAPVHAETGDLISSTTIRRAITRGDLTAAAMGLGRLYSLCGKVTGGDGRGRLLGYPTLNITQPPGRKLLPPDGVYAVRVQTPQGPFAGMMNLGPRPTFGDSEHSVEVHVFDAAHDWYGASVRVDLVGYIRETRAFSGPDALREQLGRDEGAARALLEPPTP